MNYLKWSLYDFGREGSKRERENENLTPNNFGIINPQP
jgi:hypothetical protein